jgi:hypothetical protein
MTRAAAAKIIASAVCSKLPPRRQPGERAFDEVEIVANHVKIGARLIDIVNVNERSSGANLL